MRAALACLAALLGGCATLGVQTFRSWSPPDKRYSVDVPRSWEAKDQSSLPIPGLILTNRRAADRGEPAPTIKLAYFPAGNTFVGDWLEALRKSAPSSKVVEATLTGRKAHVAERRYTEPFPPTGGGSQVFSFRSMLVFIEDAGGFWEFQYTATDDRYNSGLKTFDRLIHSLHTGG